MVQARPVLDTPIFHKSYDLYKLLHSLQPLIPKAQRYTLWQRCENKALELLEAIIETSFEEERLPSLCNISNKLDLLKVLIRLAKETRTITCKQYTTIQTHIQEIGRMIGGWIKSAAH